LANSKGHLPAKALTSTECKTQQLSQ